MKKIVDFLDPQQHKICIVGQNNSGRSTLLSNFFFLSNYQKEKLKISNEKDSNLSSNGGNSLHRRDSASSPLLSSSPFAMFGRFSDSFFRSYSPSGSSNATPSNPLLTPVFDNSSSSSKTILPFEPSCQIFDFATQPQDSTMQIVSPIFSIFQIPSSAEQIFSADEIGAKQKIQNCVEALKSYTKTYKRMRSLEMGNMCLNISSLLLNLPLKDLPESDVKSHFKPALGIVLVVDGYDLQSRMRNFISAEQLNAHIANYEVISTLQKNVSLFLDNFRHNAKTKHSKKKPILVLLNKLDLKKAEFLVSVGPLLSQSQKTKQQTESSSANTNKGTIWKFWSDMEIKQALFPDWMDDDRFALVSVSALTGENVMEVFDWFFGCIAE